MERQEDQNTGARVDQFLVDHTRRRIREEALKHSISADLAERVFELVSGLDPKVISGSRRSPAGAIGAMGLLPGNASELGVDPEDLEQNIAGGVCYLALLLEAFDGNAERAFVAYKAGAWPIGEEIEKVVETENNCAKTAVRE